MGYAFISYSSKNQSLANAMKSLLTNKGIASWMAPEDIPAGSRYAQVINRAIKECACFILLLTDDSQNSVWVAKEIERAINFRKTIIPIQLEDIAVNDEFDFYISTAQKIVIPELNANLSAVKRMLSSILDICGCEQADLNQTDVHPTEHSSEASDFFYQLYFSGDSGCLRLFSSESTSETDLKYHTITDNEWGQLSKAIQDFVAFVYKTDIELVSITPRSKLTNIVCSPSHGYPIHDNSEIRFDVSYIGKSDIYNSVHIDVKRDVSLTFFKNGHYAHKSINTSFTDMGLDEATCVALSRNLLRCLFPSRKVLTGDKIEAKIYSDLSGHFYLQYILR